MNARIPLLLLTFVATSTTAQTYPAKPVRVVVAFAPGGTTDILGRIYSQKLSAATGQQFVVDNRTGAGGTIGTEAVVRAAPDGYTINFGSTSSLAVSPNLYLKLSYDLMRDVAPVIQVATASFMLAVHPSVPAKTMRELITLARARPGQLNYASSGSGSSLHLCGEYLKYLAKIEMDVLTKHGIRATATTNTDICVHHPQIIEDAVKLGWEFMGHNKTNSTRLTALEPEQERELIRYCTKRLTEATGKRPVGWLGSGLAETWNTLDYLAEEDYLCVSDWVNDDQPYRMMAGGKELVYLPYSYEVNDSGQVYYRFASGEDFGQIIRNTFDVLYAEGAESARVMAICLHPFMTGVPNRIGALDKALAYIKGHDGVWFATGEEIVRAYLASKASI